MEDRPLRADESAFLNEHRNACRPCERLASGAVGLNMLRDAIIEPKLDRTFDERVVRRLHVQEHKTGFAYWSPALLSGAIAGLAILAAIQMISKPEQMPVFKGTGEAKKISRPIFPELKEFTSTTHEP